MRREELLCALEFCTRRAQTCDSNCPGFLRDDCVQTLLINAKETILSLLSKDEAENVPCKEPEPWTRQRVLKEAEKCVCGGREQDYGSPENSFKRIADLWNAYCGFDDGRGKFSAVDVAIMMALLKVARIANNPGHMDSYVDGCGYFACGGEIAGKEAQEGGNGSP